MSTREKLLSLRQRQTQLLTIPMLGDVVIQVPAEGARAEIETALGALTVKRLIVVHCLVDGVDLTDRKPGETWMADPGQPVFRKLDIDNLAAVNSTVIDDIVEAATKLMRMSQEDMSALLGEPGRS